MRISIPVSAFVAAIVGFGGTLALIIAAADAVGATQAQTASGVTALCLAMAVETLYLSWRTKMPVIIAWSTPGAALIAASQRLHRRRRGRRLHHHGAAAHRHRPVRAADPADRENPGLGRLGHARRHRRHLRHQRREDHPRRSLADPAADRRLLRHPRCSIRRFRCWPCSSAAGWPPFSPAVSAACRRRNSRR